MTLVNTLPPTVGIGLKPQHYDAVLCAEDHINAPDWVEVHPQNYFGLGGLLHKHLSAIAESYPVSFHSVGMSLGSAHGLYRDDLEQIAGLCARYNPAAISDHLSFSGDDANRFADLLPVPYTAESLDHFAAQIGRAQDCLGRSIMIENPARMLAYRADAMTETEFIAQLISQAGCMLLLDINNVEVSAANLGFDAQQYLDSIDPDWVGEIHVAGHAVEHHDSGVFLIDNHGSAVSDTCWDLYARFMRRAGPKPTLVEWDTDVPEYATLMAEVAKAREIMDARYDRP